MEALAVRHLTVTYPECDSPVLRDLSLTVQAGELCVLCGPTGCGKTTLLRMCKPALSPLCTQSGDIHVFGQPLSAFLPCLPL